jgi:cyclic beta-1,2-glucan synthetase
MSSAVVIGATVFGVRAVTGATALPVSLAALPLAALWIVSPAIARALSARTRGVRRTLSARNRDEAARYARLHWHYFDHFVTADTQWLVPDNFQEDPLPAVAMRTSPTNIGLQLLAIASARDLGFIDTLDITAATSSTGTISPTCASSSRPTYRRWTAATWPAISLRSGTPVSLPASSARTTAR